MMMHRRRRSPYDLVETMQFLYVRVVKARGLPCKDAMGSCDPYAEVRLGDYRAMTRFIVNNPHPEWNQVCAFSKDKIKGTMLEVSVKEKDIQGDFIGRVLFDITDVAKLPPDSPLAPEWYWLEDRNGIKLGCELMLALWWGTQADEAFPEALHSDAATVGGPNALSNVRSKVYASPKLWYLRVNVIEAQDLIPTDRARSPEVLVKAVYGHQALRTKISLNKSINPMWNEDLMFVVDEPFDEHLRLSVEDMVAPNKAEVLGMCVIPLQYVHRRLDYTAVKPRWCDLENHVMIDGDKKVVKLASKIHMRVCLEGGYHVHDESVDYISDRRPTAKQLWKNSIGVLEVGILGAHGLSPMKTRDGRETTDAYCVAKYGPKWVKTRTIVDSLMPKWNEQYTWEVFDSHTVITIGVFDNCLQQGERDSRIGKVRIRLSTLETDRVYTLLRPLLVLHPSGVKKMGEIHLAVRFTCTTFLTMMETYLQPTLPKMHSFHPLTVAQLDSLRHHATQIVSMRLSRAEPPLRKEVVEFMLDVGSHMWSMRRGKANFFRIKAALGGLIALGKRFEQMCNWENPLITGSMFFVFVLLVCFPNAVLPSIFLFLFLNGLLGWRRRPKTPLHIDTHISFADNALPDELDEEFDTFPTSRPENIVRMRYDRLRSISGRVQTVLGDLATQCERLESLLSWRDPRATGLFVVFCFIATIVLYITPLRLVVTLTGLYALVIRHPRFRRKLPSLALNFYSRLPTRTDCML